MKCSVCGNEFGSGTTCQHCGSGRVVAGAKYNGYTAPKGVDKITVPEGHPTKEGNATAPVAGESFKVCHFCGEIVPVQAIYCPHCRKKLVHSCPCCGKEFSTEYRNCMYCGVNIDEYRKQQAAEKARQKREQEKREAEERQRQEEERRRQEEERLRRQREEEERRRKEAAARSQRHNKAENSILDLIMIVAIFFAVFIFSLLVLSLIFGSDSGIAKLLSCIIGVYGAAKVYDMAHK